jgi:hypothetical protein
VSGRTRALVAAAFGVLASAACQREAPEGRAGTPDSQATSADSLAVAASGPWADAALDSLLVQTAPDSAWVTMTGPTLIAFHPVASNDSLESDEGLATALDDLAYHIGTAMDSLIAAGYTVHYRAGDTLWYQFGGQRGRFTRDADSATVGYLFVDALGRRAALYGVRGYTDLIEYAHEFKRSGAVAPR